MPWLVDNHLPSTLVIIKQFYDGKGGKTCVFYWPNIIYVRVSMLLVCGNLLQTMTSTNIYVVKFSPQHIHVYNGLS